MKLRESQSVSVTCNNGKYKSVEPWALYLPVQKRHSATKETGTLFSEQFCFERGLLRFIFKNIQFLQCNSAPVPVHTVPDMFRSEVHVP